MSIQIPLGRIGFVPRGNYTAGQTYLPLDVVAHQNTLWACLQATTAAPAANSPAWALLLKGLDAFPATPVKLGGVMIGEGLNINASGLLSVAVMEGSGLVMDSKGRIYFDPGQMPTDQFEALLKAIRAPIWVKGNLTLYVRTDGNDANNGLADTPAGAKKTVQGAVNELVDNYNLSVFNCTIKVGPGHFPQFACPSYNASTGIVTVQGAGIDQTFLDGSNVLAVINMLTACGTWDFSGFSVTLNVTENMVGSRQGMLMQSGCKSTISNIKYIMNETAAETNGMHAISCVSGTLSINSGVIFQANGLASGSKLRLIRGSSGAVFSVFQDMVMNGVAETSVAISESAVYRRDRNNDPVITGTVVGKRFSVASFGQIYTGGGGANYFPGSIAGTIDSATFGIYQ